MGCGESDSAACVATGPCRPERRIAPLTEISSRSLGFAGRGSVAHEGRLSVPGPFASAGERRSLRRERDWQREAELP